MTRTDFETIQQAVAGDGPRWIARVGVAAWSFVGAVAAIAIVIGALAAVSEIILPMVFAAVLAVLFKPVVRSLEQRHVKSSLAASIV